jgi:hypothetical protein
MWNIDGQCLQLTEDGENPLEDLCPTATLEINTAVSGSLSFDADGRYDRATTIGGNSVLTIPADCLQMGFTCDALQGLLAMGDPDDPDAPAADVTCIQNAETDPCVCRVGFEESSSVEVGAYEVADASLTLTPDEGQDDVEPSTLEFCVDGNDLTIFIAAEEDDPAVLYRLSR